MGNRVFQAWFSFRAIILFLALGLSNCTVLVYECDREYENYSGSFILTGVSWQLPDATYDNNSGPDQILAVGMNEIATTGYDKLVLNEQVFFSTIYENQNDVVYNDPITVDFEAIDGRLIYNIYLFENDVTKGTAERICRSSEMLAIDGGETLSDVTITCRITADSAAPEDIEINIETMVVEVRATETVTEEFVCEELPGGGR